MLTARLLYLQAGRRFMRNQRISRALLRLKLKGSAMIIL